MEALLPWDSSFVMTLWLRRNTYLWVFYFLFNGVFGVCIHIDTAMKMIASGTDRACMVQYRGAMASANKTIQEY